MATYQTDIAKKGAARLVSEGLTCPNFVNAGLYYMCASIEVPTTAASGDTIELTYPLPPGMALIPSFSYIVRKNPSAATSLSLTIGDEDDPDRYCTTVAVNTASANPTKVDFAGADTMLAPVTVTPDKPITATLTAASGVPAGTILTFQMAMAIV